MSLAGLSHGRPSTLTANHPPRTASTSLFTLFTPLQIKQFQEAFSLIDSDHNGFISKEDLELTFGNLGVIPKAGELDAMVSDRPGGVKAADSGKGVGFTMFLTMMAEHLAPLSPSSDLLTAFSSFDMEDESVISMEELRHELATSGDKMSPAEIDRFLNGPYANRSGGFNYKEFVNALRINDTDADKPTESTTAPPSPILA